GIRDLIVTGVQTCALPIYPDGRGVRPLCSGGPQIFIAKAAGHLNITVVPRDHQDLLVKLWRLRQGIKQAVVNAARNKIIASSFRSEERRVGKECRSRKSTK